MACAEETPHTPEEALLRDDIKDILKENAFILDISQSDDLEQPLAITIGGKLRVSSESSSYLNVRVESVVYDHELVSYITVGNKDFVLDSGGVYDCEKAEFYLGDEEIGYIRYWLRETSWNAKSTQLLIRSDYNRWQ
jgi:hypothetical protein